MEIHTYSMLPLSDEKSCIYFCTHSCGWAKPFDPYFRHYIIHLQEKETKRQEEGTVEKLFPVHEGSYLMGCRIATLNSKAYVVGGLKIFKRDGRFTMVAANEVNTFNPCESPWIWQTCPSMNFGRECPALVVADGKLYAFGVLYPSSQRKKKIPDSPERFVEVFDPLVGKWKVLEELPRFDFLKDQSHYVFMHAVDEERKMIIMQMVNKCQLSEGFLCFYKWEEKIWQYIKRVHLRWDSPGVVLDGVMYYCGGNFLFALDLAEATAIATAGSNHFPLVSQVLGLEMQEEEPEMLPQLIHIGNKKLCLLWTRFNKDGVAIVHCTQFRITIEEKDQETLYHAVVEFDGHYAVEGLLHQCWTL